MKLHRFDSVRNGGREPRLSGTTLAELMIAMTVFSFVVLALVYTQMFCMRYDQLVCSKLGASDKSRLGFDLMTRDIRMAKQWNIGNGNRTNFVACGNATNQVGNAVKLWLTADTNNANCVVYFYDTNRAVLCRAPVGAAKSQIIATNLAVVTSNSSCFRAEDYRGTLMKDISFKYVIATKLEFKEYQYPKTMVGPDYYYNYYRLQFKVASHNFD